MLDIYVDGDACPVKGEVERVADRHGLTVYIVTNGGVRPSANPKVRHVIVTEGADAADDWIAEHIQPFDIAITADIPLGNDQAGEGSLARPARRDNPRLSRSRLLPRETPKAVGNSRADWMFLVPEPGANGALRRLVHHCHFPACQLRKLLRDCAAGVVYRRRHLTQPTFCMQGRACRQALIRLPQDRP